jgi:Holliday junction resolvase-like predicted endonuclease
MKKLPLEKEVEAAFLDYLKQNHHVWKLVYRQVRLPLGVADIVALSTAGIAAVVEVKRETIDRKTVGQLVGYIGQVNNAIEM